jgi:CheY-like chemotaxis protein
MIETQRSAVRLSPVVIDNGPGSSGAPAATGLRPVCDLEAEGHGLGLRSCAHHRGARGAVEVDNAPQGGARVRSHCRRPRVRRAAPRRGERKHEFAENLVVDDEADIRGLLSEILAEEGYEIEVAADAASARRAAARQEPDLVLLDIWMPDMDGITLLREWNEKNSLRCPVVMLRVMARSDRSKQRLGMTRREAARSQSPADRRACTRTGKRRRRARAIPPLSRPSRAG